MSFSYSSEQLELKQMLERFFEEQVGAEYVRSRFEGAVRHDEDLIAAFRELGLFSFFASGDEADGANFGTLSLIATLAGRALLPEPLVTWIFSGPYLAAHLLPDKKALPEMIGEKEAAAVREGEVFFASATHAQCRDLTVAESKGEFFASGNVRCVYGAEISKRLLLWTDTGVFLSRGELGVESLAVEPILKSVDQTLSSSRVVLRDAPLFRLDIDRAKIKALQSILIASELFGVASRAVEMTVEYVKTRKQFDVPVGGFQAVQQKLADMHAQAESLGALTHFAGWSADASPEQVDLAAGSALQCALSSVPKIVEQAIQLHGGIGFTWEHDLHFFLRRAQYLRALHVPQLADHRELLAATGML